MSILFLSVCPSLTAMQPNDKFGCHEHQGWASEPAKDPVFSCQLTFSSAKFRFIQHYFTPEIWQTEKNSVGYVVGKSFHHPMIIFTSSPSWRMLVCLSVLNPNLTCQAWTESSIHKRWRSNLKPEAAGIHTWPPWITPLNPSPSPNISPESFTFQFSLGINIPLKWTISSLEVRDSIQGSLYPPSISKQGVDKCLFG